MIILPQAICCTSLEEHRLFLSSAANRIAYIEAFEAGLLGAETFTIPGYCAVCDREAAFLVDHLYCFTAPDGRRIPNWRERLVCSQCGRQRHFSFLFPNRIVRSSHRIRDVILPCP